MMRLDAFARWAPRWRIPAVTLGFGALLVAAVLGFGEAAAILLAGVGAMAAVLFAAGLMQVARPKDKLDGALRQLLHELPGAFAITDKRGAMVFENAAFAAALGGLYPDGNLSTLGARQPEIAAALFRLFAAARKGKSHGEAISLPGAEQTRQFRLRVAPLNVAGRASPLYLWHLHDQSCGRPSQSLLDALPYPAFCVEDLKVQAANEPLKSLLGFLPTGEPAWKLFAGRRGQALSQERFKELTAKSVGPIALRLATAQRHEVPVALYRWATAEVAGPEIWTAIPQTASEETAEAAFESLLSRTPIPMAIGSFKGVLLQANEAFAQLVSERSEAIEFVGKALPSLLSDASAKVLRDRLSSFAPGTAAPAAEISVSLKRAPEKRIRLTLFPDAAAQHLLVMAADSAQAEPVDAQALQIQKLQAVGELAGGIAHDFNNLLTGIIGPSDLLLSRFRPSDAAFKDLMDIKNNATRAAELVKQILAYSRQQTLRPAVLKLTDVIEEFQATMGRTLGEKVKAKINHGRDLWLVKADEGQLFQVIMNLAVNARDAMPGGGEIAIRTANVTERESLSLKDRGLARGEYVLCEVSDTGTGIRPEHLDKIFDPFFSTKEIGKGTGLGLSTVYGIVKQTGGAILVDSKLGVGTTFRIYLPRYVESERETAAPEPAGKSKPTAPPKPTDLTGKGTVLVVEDEDAVRSFTSRALSTRGYTVLEATSGLEALEIMERHEGRVDLVVSDVVMPEMDGPTLLRHLRERNPGVKIVFMSGYAEEAFRKNLGEGEDFIFLPKPFNLKTLAETVKLAVA